MALGALIVATIVDLAIAALLVGVSGFVAGAGPESMHSDAAALGWVAAVIFCLAAPIAGFVMRACRWPGAGAMIAWLPPLAALAAVAVPPPY